MKKAELLDAAKAAVADRGLNYGKVEDNFWRIANLWSVHLSNRVRSPHETESGYLVLTPADVTIMMALLKLARLENQPNHDDSWIDVAGYAACGAELFDKAANSA